MLGFTTSMALDLPALYAFICGRGAPEKTLAELKGEFTLDVVPTRPYGANSAWQQLSVLAHNLIRSFRLDTLREPKPRSRCPASVETGVPQPRGV
jgi:hypothetical protein